jgi:hypothetical protein
MSSHPFNFDGGDYLASMGASWFVSYAYYTHIDKSHDNWKRNITTVEMRTGVFNRTSQYHKFWLEEIIGMNEDRLKTNEIELSSEQVKEMARELLKSKNWRGEIDTLKSD